MFVYLLVTGSLHPLVFYIFCTLCGCGAFSPSPQAGIHPVTVGNEGLGRDPLLKMVHNPGGDWHPGWGVDPNYIIVTKGP